MPLQLNYLKASFNILPAAAEAPALHLLVESGDHGISLLWYTKSPFAVKGLSAFTHVGSDSAAETGQILDNLHDYLHNLLSVTILYDVKESMLVPAAFHHESSSGEMLDLFHGKQLTDTVIQQEALRKSAIYNHYRINKKLDLLLKERFPSARFFHSSSLQAEFGKPGNPVLHAIFFQDAVKLILFSEGRLQIIQTFAYQSPADVLYHLVNVCEQYAVKTDIVKLQLSGMINEGSALYKEIYPYFLKIGFDSLPADTIVADGINELPGHLFSHLTSLATCVS